jgi:hypothetical protein
MKSSPGCKSQSRTLPIAHAHVESRVLSGEPSQLSSAATVQTRGFGPTEPKHGPNPLVLFPFPLTQARSPALQEPRPSSG